MTDAANYRRRAEDCARRASEAQDDYHRENFQQLADLWTDMAERTESRAAGDRDGLDEALATIRNV